MLLITVKLGKYSSKGKMIYWALVLGWVQLSPDVRRSSSIKLLW